MTIPSHARDLAKRLGDGRGADAMSTTRHSLIEAVATRRARRIRKFWVGALGVSLASFAAVVAFLYVGGDDRQNTIAFWVNEMPVAAKEGADILAREDTALPIRFSDGTTLSMQPRSRGRIARASRGRVEVHVDSGRVNAAVTPGTNIRWRFDAGPYAVHVTGTQLAVEWEPEHKRFVLEVYEGHVVAQGPGIGAPTRVEAGERLRVMDDGTVRLSRENAAELPEDDARHDVDRTDEREPRARNRRGMQTPSESQAKAEPRWLTLANAGQSQQAIAEARRIGLNKIVDTASVSELEALADAARAARDAAAADVVLGGLERRFPQSVQGRLVPFLRGKVEADVQDRPKEAARFFEEYLQKNPNGLVAQEARGRLLDALIRAKDVRAKEHARDYLERYPEGPYHELAKRIIADAPRPR